MSFYFSTIEVPVVSDWLVWYNEKHLGQLCLFRGTMKPYVDISLSFEWTNSCSRPSTRRISQKFVSFVFAGAALPDHVGSARNKLLSLILFLVWIITGLVCISRMSYNKFFLLMSSTFLVHAFFGPVWCLRRLAFCIGVCMWMGSLVSNKPIPAAITVLVAFTLTGLRKWRKKVAMTTKTSDLLKLNESLEQRLDGIEKKLDVLVSKLNVICGGSS